MRSSRRFLRFHRLDGHVMVTSYNGLGRKHKHPYPEISTIMISVDTHKNGKIYFKEALRSISVRFLRGDQGLATQYLAALVNKKFL